MIYDVNCEVNYSFGIYEMGDAIIRKFVYNDNKRIY